MEQFKHWLDYLALAITALSGWLPTIAIVLSIVWTVIRIWETVTIQGWLGKERRAAVRVSRTREQQRQKQSQSQQNLKGE